MPLDPFLAALLQFVASAGRPMAEGTPDQARRSFRTLTVDLRDPASLVAVAGIEDISIGDLPARVYRPEAAGPLPTIVYFHGGGFTVGDLDTHELVSRALAVGCDAVVVAVDYRLAPEHPWPAGVDDAIAATRWVAEHLGELGGDDRLAVAGDSAGGNLATIVVQVWRDEGRPLAGQLLMYPVTDIGAAHPSMTENAEGYLLDVDTMAWFQRQYTGHLPAADLSDPRLSPIHGDLHGLAPAVIAVAEFDPLRDDGLAYAAALEEAGVPVQLRNYPGLIHGFADLGRHSPNAQAAADEIYALFRRLLSGAR